ncbi:hypothetical protein PMIN04_003943 [Paraphaeosphaeria minitans]
MASTNFWSSLDTDAPKLPAELPIPTRTATRTAYASKRKMRLMEFDSEVSIEATVIDTTTTIEDEATGTSTRPEPAQAGESNPAELPENAQKAAEYAAQKKNARKAAKKLRQKMKQGIVAHAALSQSSVGVAQGVLGTHDSASSVAVASEVIVHNPGQVQSRSEHEDGDDDVFVDAPCASDSVDIEESAGFSKVVTATEGHGDGDGNYPRLEIAAPTAVQVDVPVAPCKNTVANKRKKANKKKMARGAKVEAGLCVKLRRERIEAWMMGLAAVCFACVLLWSMHAHFVRR